MIFMQMQHKSKRRLYAYKMKECSPNWERWKRIMDYKKNRGKIRKNEGLAWGTTYYTFCLVSEKKWTFVSSHTVVRTCHL